ncbi:MAG: prenyltransferase/squalene oxidase repeat-containing protein [Planctomycetota bacterium]
MRPTAILLVLLAGAHAEESLGARVNEALDRAAAHLITKQNADGSWNKEDKVHPLGRTALCTYALLHTGLAKDHPAVAKGMAFLAAQGFKPNSTYEAGCFLLLLHTYGSTYDQHIQRICAWLAGNLDQTKKLWGYPDGRPDLSNTQYAVFGLKVGEMHGFDVPKSLWRSLIRGVSWRQHENGAFIYRDDYLYGGSMTHAGLMVLHFAGEALGKTPGGVKQAMARGRKWYEQNYSVTHVPYGRGHHKGHYYYYMYGLARYAEIFGLKKIAGHDWYREGAEELLRRQGDNGAWGRLEETCFAILFLRKVVFTRPTVRQQGPVKARKTKKPERPRPDENVPFQREWLLAGPYRGHRRDDDMLFLEHVKIARAKPAAGRKAGKGSWEAHRSPEDEVDLKKAAGAGDGSTYYAALYLHATAATDAVLWIGTDDGCQVYLNGEQLLEGHHHDYSGDDFYRVPLALAAGRNLLLVKVENANYYAKLKARLSGPQGGPLAGVAASLKRRP